MSILKRQIKCAAQEVSPPDFIDAAEVNRIIEGATVIEQYYNEDNYCVLSVWVNEREPEMSSVYFSCFFNLNGKTVVSHDAYGGNILTALIKFSNLINTTRSQYATH